ncbi:nicalin-1-like [Agrilus planipennis]|nr:nicalin-1-like [Agrilus planipennis]
MVAEALAKHIYNFSEGSIFKGSLGVQKSHLEAWISYLSSQPRSPQLLCNKDNILVNSLQEAFNRFLREIKVSTVQPDKRDPDFTFYDVTKGMMNIYSVKPAVFDLVLTIVIVLYLSIVYLVVLKFPYIYVISCNLISYKKVKAN